MVTLPNTYCKKNNIYRPYNRYLKLLNTKETDVKVMDRVGLRVRDTRKCCLRHLGS